MRCEFYRITQFPLYLKCTNRHFMSLYSIGRPDPVLGRTSHSRLFSGVHFRNRKFCRYILSASRTWIWGSGPSTKKFSQMRGCQMWTSRFNNKQDRLFCRYRDPLAEALGSLLALWDLWNQYTPIYAFPLPLSDHNSSVGELAVLTFHS